MPILLRVTFYQFLFFRFYLFLRTEKNYIFLVLFSVDDGIEVKRTRKNRKKLEWNFCNFQFCVFPHFIQILEITKNIEIFPSLNLTSFRQKTCQDFLCKTLKLEFNILSKRCVVLNKDQIILLNKMVMTKNLTKNFL